MVQPEYRGEAEAKRKPTSAEPRSRGLAFVLSLVVSGLGHAYLGQWRRAALWVAAPIMVLLVFCACTILIPWRAAFQWVAPAMVLVMGLAWCGAAGDVWLIPRSLFRKPALWKLPLFWLGNLTFSVAAALAARMFLLQAFKVPGGSMQPALMGFPATRRS
jgi:hypothetical protein